MACAITARVMSSNIAILLQENELVAKELELLANTCVIYRTVGNITVSLKKPEALSINQRRISFLNKQLKETK
jgi:chaperonin cofactor prefoldin